MNLLQLKYFMSAAESLNFTKAANSLFTYQSNISKQIYNLENELETDLFERKNVGVALTPAGELLYKGLLELEPCFTNLINQVKEISKKSTYKVIIAFSESMDFNRIMPQVFEDLINNEEHLEVIVESYSIEKVIEKLLLKEIDIAMSFNLVEIHNADILRHPISRAKSLIYYSKKNPLYYRKNLKLENFENEVLYLLDNPVRKKEFDPTLYLPFTPRKVIKLKSINSIILNIEQGKGITIFGQSQNFLGKESLATFNLEIDELIVGADAIWLNTNTNPGLPVFFKYIKKYFPT